jgi:hypothetical protein
MEAIKETPKVYSVWVGGVEVNDYYLTREKALRVEAAWKDYGYPEATLRQEIEVNNA